MENYEKRGYLLENFRLFHLSTPQAPKVELHDHEFCKLLLLLSGRGSYVVEGQRYLLQPGDAVLIGSRCVHRPELEQDTPYERIIIFISPEFLQKASTDDFDLTECFGKKPVLRLPEPGRKKLFDLAAALERDLSGEAYGRELLSSAALLRLLVQLMRQQRYQGGCGPQPVETQNSRVLEMMRYMDAHLEEDLDIDSIAENFYISKYHMMRQFRRETGSSVYDYLIQRRLLHARELMRQGMRATEACYRSGFRSYSSFTRAYGRHFGTTPTGRADLSREAPAENE